MFGRSYSDLALNKFLKAIKEFDHYSDELLSIYPVDGVKPQSELIVDGIGSIFNRKKKTERLNKFIWTTGVWMYLVDYYYDGKKSHRDKFLKEGIKEVAPFGRGELFNSLKKHSKNINNTYFRAGLTWGEEFNNRLLNGNIFPADEESQIEDFEVDDSFFGKEGKMVTVLAPKEKEFYKKGKILIDRTYFDMRNPDNNSFNQHDFRYLLEHNTHLICRRGESNHYYELFSDETISGVFDPYSDIEFLGYDDELSAGKEIFQFETKDKSLPDQIELKIRKSNKYKDDLMMDAQNEIERILEKNSDALINNQEVLINSSKYKDKVNFTDAKKNQINLEYLNELLHSNEVIIEQILENLIEHLNDCMDMQFTIEIESKQFRGLSDLKVLLGGYCFLRRRKRVVSIDHEDWRYGWESAIASERYLNNHSGSISFIDEVFNNVCKHYFDGLLDDSDSKLNLESIYSSFHDFKEFGLKKLNLISNKCYEPFSDEFNLRFYEWKRFNNKFDYIFLILMINPLEEDNYSSNSKVILKMEGNTKKNQVLLTGMSLIDDDFNNGDGWFSEDYPKRFSDIVEMHLISPLNLLLKDKNAENSYRDIYLKSLDAKVLLHGEFIKEPLDTVIKDFRELNKE